MGNQRKTIMSDELKRNPAAQETHAARAMELKQAAPDTSHPSTEPTAHHGTNDIPNNKLAPSGAFDAEDQRPVLERSRKSR